MNTFDFRKLIQVNAWPSGVWDTLKAYLAASWGAGRAMTSKGIVHVVDDEGSPTSDDAAAPFVGV